MRRFISLTVFLLLLGISTPWAKEQMDWPCYHGIRRDNKSTETGLLKTWPGQGPRLLWTASGIGQGYSSVAVSGNRLYTAGMVGKETQVFALDLNGDILWQRPAGESWEAAQHQHWAVPYAGSRATPTVDGDTVYFLSELGILSAFDAANGETRWSLDIAQTFEADKPEYGYSESVLIQGDRLFCCPGGKKAYMVALDKHNGDLLWANDKITDEVGNSSSVWAQIEGQEQIISVTSARIFAVNPDNGQLLWQYPFSNKRSNNATDVIVQDGLVYASSGYGKGSVLLKPERSSEGAFTVKTVWETELLDNHHGGVVLVDGHLYGAGHEAKGWFCLNFQDGQPCWQSKGKGSLTYADGHLYALDEKGRLALVKADPQAYSEAGQFKVPNGGTGAYWAHPVVCRGRLYVRHADQLYAYDLRKAAAPGEMAAAAQDGAAK